MMATFLQGDPFPSAFSSTSVFKTDWCERKTERGAKSNLETTVYIGKQVLGWTLLWYLKRPVRDWHNRWSYERSHFCGLCAVLFPIISLYSLWQLHVYEMSERRLCYFYDITFSAIWKRLAIVHAAHTASLLIINSCKVQNGYEIWPNSWKSFCVFMAVADATTWKELTIGVR